MTRRGGASAAPRRQVRGETGPVETEPSDGPDRRTAAQRRPAGLRTFAEGIETPAQLHCLREMGCRYGQGFLFSPPVPPDVARAMLAGAPWAAQWPL